MQSKCSEWLLCSTLILGWSAASAQTPSQARERIVTVGGKSYQLTSKLKKILVGDFFYNYDHHQNNSPQNMLTTLNRLAAKEGWTVDVTTDGNAVTAAKLRGYNVFFANYISSWASTNGFPVANRTAVQDFVETQGGGLFILHSSGDSKVSDKWDWYYKTAHPVAYEHETSRLTISAPVTIPPPYRAHPIVEGIKFNGKDTVIFPQGEWHTFAHLITETYPNAEILLSMNGAKCTKGGTGTNCGMSLDVINYDVPGGYPASWTFPDKKGRIGYFMEAHDLVTMQALTEPIWDKFFTQFLYYIAGYDTTAAGTSVRRAGHADLDFALDPSGVTFHPGNGAGVLIDKRGRHAVALTDLSGHLVKEYRGQGGLADYDLSGEMARSGPGIYFLRVTLPGLTRTKRLLQR